MNLDTKLIWQENIKKNVSNWVSNFKEIYWFLGADFELTESNKIMLYKLMLKPVWTYGILIWRCASTSNVEIKRRFKNKVLRNIVVAS